MSGGPESKRAWLELGMKTQYDQMLDGGEEAKRPERLAELVVHGETNGQLTFLWEIPPMLKVTYFLQP